MGLGPQNLWHDFQIPKVLAIQQADFNLNLDLLPREDVTGDLRMPSLPHTAPPRCKIIVGKRIAEGGFSYIHRVKRLLNDVESDAPLCVKIPKTPSTQPSFWPEALVQWICSKSLNAAGIHGAIPQVHDIYRYVEQTRFTMDYIEGQSAIQTIYESPTPDTTWLQILAQVALILGYLEENVRLDHRDLKADNLWIRPQRVSYTLKVGGVTWHIDAPFQVVFLDFGYACIGNDSGFAAVTLIDGELPLIDPCPKEGRDLFQLVGCVLMFPQVRARFSAEILAEMEFLLKYKDATFSQLTQNIKMIYRIAGDARFRLPPLHPVSVLERLAHEWYPTAGVSVVSSNTVSAPRIEFITSRPNSARPDST